MEEATVYCGCVMTHGKYEFMGIDEINFYFFCNLVILMEKRRDTGTSTVNSSYSI